MTFIVVVKELRTWITESHLGLCTHVDVAFFAKNVAHDADAARVGGLVAGGEGEARRLRAIVLSVAQFALLSQSGGHLQQGRPVVSAVEVTQLQAARQVVRFARVFGALLRVLQSSEQLGQTDVHLHIKKT